MEEKEQSALHSSELVRLGSDPKDPGDEIWRLSLQLRFLKEELDVFAWRCRKELSLESICLLEVIQSLCDSMLYESCEMYCKKSMERPPEGQ